MRYSAIILLSSILLACGNSAPQRHTLTEPLASGSGLFTLRFNPVRSLADRPELALEVSSRNGWERVAVIDEDPGRPVVARMLRTLSATPENTVTVFGELTSDTLSWGQGHASRVLEIERISDAPTGPSNP